MTYQVIRNKYNLTFIFAVFAAGAISFPMIYSHIGHSDHILHSVIHAAGFVLATSLATLVFVGWKKTKNFRMFFSTCAFSVLATAQGIYMYFDMYEHKSGFSAEEELFDIMIIGVIVLFAIGIFYKR